MQIRCTYCQTMIPISRDEMLAALQHMEIHKQVFYDAHCPKCRRSNRVEKKRIELLMPDWKKVIKELEREVHEDEKEIKKSDVAIDPGDKTSKPAQRKNTKQIKSSGKSEKVSQAAEKKVKKKIPSTTKSGISALKKAKA